LTMDPANLEAVRERLNRIARERLNSDALRPLLRLDAEVGLEEMTLAGLQELERLRPCGIGNPGVQFVARGLSHHRPLQRIGKDRQHVKMWVTDGSGSCEAVWWRAGDLSLPVGRFDLAFAPQINTYNGSRTVQLKVLDWSPG